MTFSRRDISCGKAALLDLCQAKDCNEEVCGTCSYCGRPICEKHGFMARDNRYYCKNVHGPHNHIKLISKVVKTMFEIQHETRIPIDEISEELIIQRVIEKLE